MTSDAKYDDGISKGTLDSQKERQAHIMDCMKLWPKLLDLIDQLKPVLSSNSCTIEKGKRESGTTCVALY